ncbi:integrase [Sporohalobacter salinus]|nr:integrase [Sporohalobacter salinus]
MESLTPLHIKKYIRYKLDSGRLDNKSGGLSKKSTRRHYVVLNNALKYAVKWQLLEDNPAKIIDAPIPEKPEIQALTQEQLEKLLEAAEGVMHDVIYLAAYTGMRRGEIFGLRWKDIDFNDGRIQVRQAVSEIRGKGLVYRKPKTSGSIRPIEIDEDIINLLKKRRKTQKEFKMKLRDVYSNEKNLVFTWKDGKAYKPRYATRQFNKIAESVGLEEFRLHDLRHTHATLMLKANVHPKIVQERLGHNSISQTLDTYSHVIPSMQKEALKKMRNRMK